MTNAGRFTTPQTKSSISKAITAFALIVKIITITTNTIMQSFTFSNLSQRGRDGAIARYWIDALTSHELDHISRNSLAKIMHATLEDIAHDCLIHLGWRYTEHGERVG